MPAVSPLVLVIEEEPQMRRFLLSTLASYGFRSLHSETRLGALARTAGHNPDLILFDIGRPDVDGVEVTRRLREWTAAPILVLSSRVREADKVAVLDAGANDYIVKPFGTGELLARMRVWLRHVARARAQRDASAARVPGVTRAKRR